ncbi:MAG: hypothetical protein NVS3B21_30810 [Acidimicrobiales bacterium]
MAYPIDRRTFLRRSGRTLGGAALLGVAGPGLLEACSSSSSSSSSSSASSAGAASGAVAAKKDFGAMNLRLSWIKNVEFAGEYIADQKGYYKAEGFSSVNLIAGGPTATPGEEDVQTGKAFMGISSPDITGPAILKGLDLKIVGAQYQKNPFAIMSAKTKPINTPQDMIGKKIGVQKDNETIWAAFLKANNIDPSKINKVTVGFDPTPLTQGTVDGWFSFITNEPQALKVKGFDTVTFLLNDFNYPLLSQTFMVKSSALKTDRDKIKAILRAEIKGWKDSITDPTVGAGYAANNYGKDQGLDATEQTLESKAQNQLVLAGDVSSTGIFVITDTAKANSIKTLALGGINITADQLFDTSVLAEVYKEDPSLKSVPTAG